MDCSKSFFSKQRDSLQISSIVGKAFRQKTESGEYIPLTQVYSTIRDGLLQQNNFIFQFEQGTHSGRFKVSLNELYSTIKDYAVNALRRRDKDNYQQSFSDFVQLLDDNLVKDTGFQDSSFVIHETSEPYIQGTDLENEESRLKEQLKQAIDSYYGVSYGAEQLRQEDFGRNIIRRLIINTETEELVNDNNDLNTQIMQYKNQMYQDILSYLDINDNVENLPQTLYDSNGKLSTNYTSTLNKFYNIVRSMTSPTGSPNAELQDLVNSQWKLAITGQDYPFLKALNSYINLTYFDKLIVDTLGGMVAIDSNLNGYEVDATYPKYSFKTTDDHKRKGWETSENRNALEDIAKFSKLVLSIVPMKSNRTGKYLNRTVGTTAFSSTITKLFMIAPKLASNYKGLKDLLYRFHENPSYYSEKIFEYIVKDTNGIKNSLQVGESLSEFDLNVIQSIYDYVFDSANPKSIKSIETKYLKRKFNIGRYSIVDSINGVMDRVMDISYLQTVYEGDQASTSLKKKFFSSRDQQNLEAAANRLNIARENRKALIDKYPINRVKPNDTSSYIITIGGTTYTATSTSSNGILGHKPLTINFSQKFRDVFDRASQKIDFTSDQTISRIISGKGLNESETIFREALQFIQDMLGLNLLSEDGLNTMFLYKTNSIDKNYIKDMFSNAIQAAVINDLYYQFELKLADGTYTSRLEFQKFLNSSYYPFSKLTNDERPNYLTVNYGITDIKTVPVNAVWKDGWARARAILSGEVSKAITKDLQGNSIANYRTSFLGGNIQYYLQKVREGETQRKQAKLLPSAASALFFTDNNEFIRDIVVSQDVQSRNGVKKNIKDLKTSELYYDAIIHNFFGSYLQNGTLVIQPTTYSDKTTFINYAIDANKKIVAEGKSYNDKSLMELNESEIIDLYRDTIGKAYENTLANVISDYRKIWNDVSSVRQVSERLKSLPGRNANEKEASLIALAEQAGVELQLDTHYRKGKKGLKFNELLQYYAFNLYKDGLKSELKLEQLNFLNDLLDSGVSFQTKYYDESTISKSKNPIAQILKSKSLSKLLGNPALETEWTKNGKLILAKVDGKDILYGSRIKNYKTLQLNPILEKYFYLDSLLSNNLRFSLTGSEVAHPDKAKIKWEKELKAVGLEKYPPFLDNKGQLDINKVSDLVDVYDHILNYSSSPNLDESSMETLDKLWSFYHSVIRKISAGAQGTQLKRNVIIPATLQYEQQNVINGVPSQIKVAVIRDIKAPVFNFRGDVGDVDAHDGSAWINPFISILENKALQDQEVGVDKKPIWHHFNPLTMSATLLKFATFTITNERMQQSLNSDINLYKLFKQMTNMQWETSGQWNNSRNIAINLVQGKGFGNKNINFAVNILQEKPLFYNNNGKHYQILDLKMDENGFYYTVETEVDSMGNPYNSSDQVNVYHLFSDQDSTHKRVIGQITPQDIQNHHRINSLYELHKSLGGIFSESIIEEDGNKSLQYSEASNYAVVNYMNNVSTRLTNDTSDFSQRTYYQPLKEMMISYAANNSAVKNGAANINESNAWYGNSNLKYMTLDTDGLGIQMDADHSIEEAEMTEFSQVISALEAGGRLHHLSKQVYRDLGQLALQASELELDAVVKFLQKSNDGTPIDQVMTDLYDVIGKTVINNYKLDPNKADLAAEIITEIANKFNLNDNHFLDELKIPFSDPNIYSNIIPTFVSIINKKSIKRKYPGSGCVMVPGYGIIQTYKINGRNYQFMDLVNRARTLNLTTPFFAAPELEGDIETYNRELVRTYLRILQEQQPEVSEDVFIPTEVVNVIFSDQQGVEHEVAVRLDDPSDYYTFTNPSKQLLAKLILSKGLTDLDGNIITSISGFNDPNAENQLAFRYRRNVTQPRNLQPARIQWTYTDKVINEQGAEEEVEKSTNIYNMPAIKHSFMFNDLYSMASKDNNDYGFYDDEADTTLIEQWIEWLKATNIDRYNNLSNIYGINEDSVLQYLKLGKIDRAAIQKTFDDLDRGFFTINGMQYRVNNLRNMPAELVMSNLYGSRFGTRGQSLADIEDQKEAFFAKRQKPLPTSFDYDFAFVKGDNRNIYLTYENVAVGKNVDPVKWKYTKLEGNVVYVTTKDNRKLFEVGRYIVRPEIDYDQKTKIFRLDGKEISSENLRVGDDGKVLEYVEFISQYRVRAQNRNGKVNQYTLYKVDKEAIRMGLINPTDNDINLYISNRLTDIFNSDSYKSIQIDNTLSSDSAELMLNTLSKMSVNDNLKELLYNTDRLLRPSQKPENKGKPYKLDTKAYRGLINLFNQQFINEQYSSFLKSLTFTASRIPAQTLQSFMQMKLVGFTQSSKNIVYVSHWQTWLQGSDYDIDKAYIMGYEFDDNGRYVGWSDLFNYSTIETLEASEYLPTPTQTNYYKADSGFDISQYVENIISLDNKADKIRAYAELLRTLQDMTPEVDGLGNKKLAVTWDPSLNGVAEEVRKQLNKHEFTELSPLMIESAYKNSVSSKIQNIVQNLRNMDAAYSPIEMEGIRSASNSSPKGNLASNMTLMNPTTKYAMQVQNMVGKGVIGITAVGEKVFFNTSYYWNEGIRREDPKWINNLKFSQTFYRIQGRASGNITPSTKTVLANVNFENHELIRFRFAHIAQIDDVLRAQFGITDQDIETRNDKWQQYHQALLNEVRSQQDIETSADLQISELLSAATDNAKELILDKINAGTNLARMYLHLIMMGFSIQDIVSFMISPVVSIINSLSEANMFDEYVYEMGVADAAKMVRGIINPKLFFEGATYNSETGETSVLSNVAFTALKKVYKKINPETGQEYNFRTIQELIQSVIQESIQTQQLPNIYQTLKDKKITVNRTINTNMQMFSDYIDSLVQKIINGVKNTPGESYRAKYTAFQEDLNEFDKIWSLATETSTLGSGFLGLNQGLPTSKQDLMSKLRVLERAVGQRESEFGIVLEKFMLGNNDSPETKEKKRQALEEILGALQNNNPLLDPQYISNTFTKARDAGIINNFNIETWLLDEYIDYNGDLIRYRDLVSDYYNIIKGTWNIFDMIEKIPQYKAIFDLFRVVYITDANTSQKSHIINLISDKIIEDSGFMDEQMVNRLLRYVDDLLITKWLRESDFKFPVFEQQKYFNKYVDRITAPYNTLIDLSTSSGRASFKLLMEQEIIPQLKNGYYYDVDKVINSDGTVTLSRVRKEVIPNAFISGLVDAVDNGVPYKKLDIDMMNVNSTPSNTIKFQEYLNGLFKLKDQYINGRSLSDWFMIYNFIVNQNRYGSDRMTTLFKSFIKLPGSDSSIIKKYFQTTGDLDYSAIKSEQDLDDLGFNIDDAFIRMAPNVSLQQERLSRSRVIRQRTRDGIVYKKRTASGGYSIIPILPKKTATGDGDYLTRNQRMRDFQEYFTMQMPSADATIMSQVAISSTDIREVIQALIDYTSNGTIKLYKENC